MTYDEWRDTYSKRGMMNEAMASAAWKAGVAAERERWKAAINLRHDYEDGCPDEVNGWGSRDAKCAACRSMAELGA